MISKFTDSLGVYSVAIILAHILAFAVYFPITSMLIIALLIPWFYMLLIYSMVYNMAKRDGIDWPKEPYHALVWDADNYLTPLYIIADYDDPFIDYTDYDPRY